MSNLRNVAVIAHVDHGKSSLVDALLKHTHAIDASAADRVMDYNPLERERGITILSKATSFDYRGVHVNFVDTPGHSDFGAEVERVLGMVESVVLVVDATEGPMTQTKFVLGKALEHGLRPLVVLNKMDRPTARAADVETEVFDLFESLGASDEQLSYPTLYASAREGWVSTDMDERGDSVAPLLDAILEHVPPPIGDPEGAFRMLITTLDVDEHFGRVVLGRVAAGSVATADAVRAIRRLVRNGDEDGNGEDEDFETVEEARVMRIIKRRGLARVHVDRADCGDIVGLCGLAKASVADTVGAAAAAFAPLIAAPVDPPVMSMVFAVNSSPLSGREGQKCNFGVLSARLDKECESNVSIQLAPRSGGVEVRGRGEMQLGVLVETLRREGFELEVSPPLVVAHEEDGVTMEPVEEVTVDVPVEFATAVMEKMSARRAQMLGAKEMGGEQRRLQYLCAARALVGARAELSVVSKGQAVLNHAFSHFQPQQPAPEGTRRGVLVATESGGATAYAIQGIEARGMLFVKPGDEVYAGQIVGEHNRPGDLDVNCVRAKQLSNMRSANKEEFSRLRPNKTFVLEEALAYIREDELLEVTPKNVRLRKKILDPSERERQRKSKKK